MAGKDGQGSKGNIRAEIFRRGGERRKGEQGLGGKARWTSSRQGTVKGKDLKQGRQKKMTNGESTKMAGGGGGGVPGLKKERPGERKETKEGREERPTRKRLPGTNQQPCGHPVIPCMKPAGRDATEKGGPRSKKKVFSTSICLKEAAKGGKGNYQEISEQGGTSKRT